MKEILDKINKVYEDVVEKQDYVVGKVKELSVKEDSMFELIKKIDARENQLNARERIVNKIEDFEKEKKELQEFKVDVMKKHEENRAQEESIQIREDKVEADRLSLENMKNLYQEKSRRLNEFEASLKEEKENMRKVVLEELQEKLK